MFRKLKILWNLRVRNMNISDFHIEEHRKRGMKIGGDVIFSQMILPQNPFLLL